jgi:hypothetical protein
VTAGRRCPAGRGPAYARLVRRLLPIVAAVGLAAGCGGGSGTPGDDPGVFAVKIVHLIVANQYEQAWTDLHPDDQKVAPLKEYVACETRSPVALQPTSVVALGVGDEPVGLGNGHSVASKAVRVRIAFPGANNVLVRTVHVVAAGGRWKWILPAQRFRDYAADRCPTATTPAPPSA